MNYYERHIGDYLKDTAHLSLLEHGVYSRLLDVYYTRECGIDDGAAVRLIGARSKEERGALESVLNEFFTLQGGIWTHKRCDQEIERYKDKQRKASASANARWNKGAAHTERNANAMRTHSEGNAPSNQTPDTNTPPAPSRGKSAAPPVVSLKAQDLQAEGVDPQKAADWLTLRKAKRLPLTVSAWDDTKAEGVKAGLTPAETVATAVKNNWCGFKASWLSATAKPAAPGKVDIYAGLAQ